MTPSKELSPSPVALTPWPHSLGRGAWGGLPVCCSHLPGVAHGLEVWRRVPTGKGEVDKIVPCSGEHVGVMDATWLQCQGLGWAAGTLGFLGHSGDGFSFPA